MARFAELGEPNATWCCLSRPTSGSEWSYPFSCEAKLLSPGLPGYALFNKDILFCLEQFGEQLAQLEQLEGAPSDELFFCASKMRNCCASSFSVCSWAFSMEFSFSRKLALIAISSSRCFRASLDFFAATLFRFRRSKYFPSLPISLDCFEVRVRFDVEPKCVRLPPVMPDDESIVEFPDDDEDMSDELESSDILVGLDGESRFIMLTHPFWLGKTCCSIVFSPVGVDDELLLTKDWDLSDRRVRVEVAGTSDTRVVPSSDGFWSRLLVCLRFCCWWWECWCWAACCCCCWCCCWLMWPLQSSICLMFSTKIKEFFGLSDLEKNKTND